MSLASGTKLGPYEILSPLGKGGMGEVFRARDSRLDRDVAIKVLPATFSANIELKQRFEREAKSISSLSHPNICTLHDIGCEDGVDYLVMEFLNGETLAQRLRKGPLPTDDVLRIGTEIASAMDKAHRAGVIHRDIKPGNMMLTKSGAKLLDFGLAKHAPGQSELASAPDAATMTEALTGKGTIVGTFQYMAPEQLEGKEADARTDIFAFGAVLYEMATGTRAFSGKSRASLIASIMSASPRPISEIQPMTPPALEQVVRTCLAKEPDDRVQTAHDVKLQLQWLAEGGSQVGAPVVTTPRRKRRAWIAVLAAVGFAIIALYYAVLFHRQTSSPPAVIRAYAPAPPNGSFVARGQGSGGAGPVCISPDGTQLAFVAKLKNGEEALYVRPLDSLVALPLPGTKGARYPFWSYDSREIGFFSDDGKLKKIGAAGGPAVTLCDAPSGRSGSWNRDGVILFAPGSMTSLHRISSAGGESQAVTNRKQGDASHRWPFFLPDGNHFLYWVREKGGGSYSKKNEIRIGSLSGETDKRLVQVSSNAAYASGHILYSRDGTLLARSFDTSSKDLGSAAVPVAEGVHFDAAYSQAAFSVSRNGVLVFQPGSSSANTQLVWYDRKGKEISTLGEPALFRGSVRLSPDGQQVATGIVDAQSGYCNLWIIEVSRGIRSRFTFGMDWDEQAVWSPDGNRLVYTSYRAGSLSQMYEKPFSGVGTEKLVFAPKSGESTRWSRSGDWPLDWTRDGRWIIFRLNADDERLLPDLWAFEVSANAAPIPIVETPFFEEEARFSPDGKWIVYSSEESGQAEIYAAPFPGPGRKWQVSTAGGYGPAWGVDGKEIYYVGRDANLMSVEVSADETGLQLGQSNVLFRLPPSTGPNRYDVTADGKKILVRRALDFESGNQLIIVTNWDAELQQK